MHWKHLLGQRIMKGSKGDAVLSLLQKNKEKVRGQVLSLASSKAIVPSHVLSPSVHRLRVRSPSKRKSRFGKSQPPENQARPNYSDSQHGYTRDELEELKEEISSLEERFRNSVGYFRVVDLQTTLDNLQPLKAILKALGLLSAEIFLKAGNKQAN